MALDDKIFQSAIAKINKMKSRNVTSYAQVQVFEDPPHLKKETLSNDDDVADINSSAVVDKCNGAINTSQQIDIIDEICSQDNNNQGTKDSTKQGTKDSTKQGTFEIKKDTVSINRVRNKGTKKGTDNSTDNGYILDDFDDELTKEISRLYKKTYDGIDGIPKKIVNVIFRICKQYNMKETPPISFGMLVKLCKEKKNSVKVTRRRLLNDGLIFTKHPDVQAGIGRSALLIYSLREDLYDDIEKSVSYF